MRENEGLKDDIKASFLLLLSSRVEDDEQYVSK
jgi:hypothetical protein